MARTLDLNSEFSDVTLNVEGTLEVAAKGRETLLTVVELLRVSQGEWNQDVTLGLPFAEDLRTGVIDRTVAASVIEATALSVPGVRGVEVTRVETDRHRRLRVDILLTTDEGAVIPIPDLSLHPSETGIGPAQPDNILAWQGNPLHWLGNYIRMPDW